MKRPMNPTEAIKWHKEFINWAYKNGEQSTDDCRAAEYALECIEFRIAVEKELKAQAERARIR